MVVYRVTAAVPVGEIRLLFGYASALDEKVYVPGTVGCHVW